MRTIIQTYKKGEMQMAYIGSSGNDTVDAMGQFAFMLFSTLKEAVLVKLN